MPSTTQSSCSQNRLCNFLKTHKDLSSILIISLTSLGLYLWKGAVFLKYAKICFWILLATSSLYYLIRFKLHFFNNNNKQEYDFKLLATFASIVLLTLYLPELISRITEYQGIKFTPQQKKETLTKFGMTTKFLSIGEPKNDIEGKFEIQSNIAKLFLKINLLNYINENNKDRKQELINSCEAIKALGTLSEEQIDFIQNNRIPPLLPKAYLFYGLPSSKFKREGDDWEKIKSDREALENSVLEVCNNVFKGKNIFKSTEGKKSNEGNDPILSYINQNNAEIEKVADLDIPEPKRRDTLSALIKALEKEKLLNSPEYYILQATLNTRLGEIYKSSGSHNIFLEYFYKVDAIYMEGLKATDDYVLRYHYCDFLTFKMLKLNKSVGCYQKAWTAMEKELNKLKKIYKNTQAQKNETKKLILDLTTGNLETLILNSKNNAIYNAALLGDLELLDLGNTDPYSFIKETFREHRDDSTLLDTEAIAFLVKGLEEECPERGAFFRSAKENLVRAKEIAYDNLDADLVTHFSAKIDYINTMDCKN